MPDDFDDTERVRDSFLSLKDMQEIGPGGLHNMITSSPVPLTPADAASLREHIRNNPDKFEGPEWEQVRMDLE